MGMFTYAHHTNVPTLQSNDARASQMYSYMNFAEIFTNLTVIVCSRFIKAETDC